MAIYHLEAKVISRGAGRSAIAAAAYMSCSQILNDYDGVQHDYTPGLISHWMWAAPETADLGEVALPTKAFLRAVC